MLEARPTQICSQQKRYGWVFAAWMRDLHAEITTLEHYAMLSVLHLKKNFAHHQTSKILKNHFFNKNKFEFGNLYMSPRFLLDMRDGGNLKPNTCLVFERKYTLIKLKVFVFFKKKSMYLLLNNSQLYTLLFFGTKENKNQILCAKYKSYFKILAQFRFLLFVCFLFCSLLFLQYLFFFHCIEINKQSYKNNQKVNKILKINK